MSRLISDILQAPEPHFSRLVQEWEDLSGRPGIDVNLSVEINQSLKSMLTALGLDPDDTTGEELYHALARRASADSHNLANHIVVGGDDSPKVMIEKVSKFTSSLPIARPAWVVKPSVARQHLRAFPPKKLMKIFGLRSIDSVLKRRHPAEILALGLLVESPKWVAKFRSRYKKLQASDFDEEKTEILTISPKYAESLRKAGYSLKELVVPVRELGATLVVPPRARFEADVLLAANMLIEALRERYMYSTFFRNLSTQPKFGENVVRTLQRGIHTTSEEIHGTSWSVLHGLAARSRSPHFQDYGPGLEFDDPEIPAVAIILSEQLPEFSFWHPHFTAKQTPDGPVSCHLSDVVMNTSSGSPYEKRTARHLQANLWDEFRIRYLLEESVAHKVLRVI